MTRTLSCSCPYLRLPASTTVRTLISIVCATQSRAFGYGSPSRLIQGANEEVSWNCFPHKGDALKGLYLQYKVD